MTGKLAIDFGTCYTAVCAWDDATADVRSLLLPDYSRIYEHDTVEMPVIPSLIHYDGDGHPLVGRQVLDNNLEASSGTFCAIKARIRQCDEQRRRFGKRLISPHDAGKDFLHRVIEEAKRKLGKSCKDIALTVPVGSFESYQEWLVSSIEQPGRGSPHIIEEPIAAVMGYRERAHNRDAYLVFDFGGGSLSVAIVVFMDEPADSEERVCHVVGKAERDLGGTDFDRLLAAELARKNGKAFFDAQVQHMLRLMLKECEQAKENLSRQKQTEVSVVSPITGAAFEAVFTREELEDLLRRSHVIDQITETMHKAISEAEIRGYGIDDIKEVLMVGGSSLIPCVQDVVKEKFGAQRVILERPLDAVARGALSILQGARINDYVKHEYAIEWKNPATGQYDYRTVIKSGTPYPTKGPAQVIGIRACKNGQSDLKLRIYEISECNRSKTFEMYFDASGHARLVSGTPNGVSTQRFYMNEGNPAFLLAAPPAERGDTLFQVDFYLDDKRRLLITTRDLRTGRILHRDYPVVKLR